MRRIYSLKHFHNCQFVHQRTQEDGHYRENPSNHELLTVSVVDCCALLKIFGGLGTLYCSLTRELSPGAEPPLTSGLPAAPSFPSWAFSLQFWSLFNIAYKRKYFLKHNLFLSKSLRFQKCQQELPREVLMLHRNQTTDPLHISLFSHGSTSYIVTNT